MREKYRMDLSLICMKFFRQNEKPGLNMQLTSVINFSRTFASQYAGNLFSAAALSRARLHHLTY